MKITEKIKKLEKELNDLRSQMVLCKFTNITHCDGPQVQHLLDVLGYHSALRYGLKEEYFDLTIYRKDEEVDE